MQIVLRQFAQNVKHLFSLENKKKYFNMSSAEFFYPEC